MRRVAENVRFGTFVLKIKNNRETCFDIKKGGNDIFSRLFQKNRAHNKKNAMVFVDFEHWYISLDKLHHQRPDIKAFRDEIAEKYNIVDIAFFADFSNPSLQNQIENIRAVSNTIIQTQNTSGNFEKDFTDFIMLDHIYQSVLNKNSAPVYIIFTGDGHFSSVVSYLVTKCRKEVLVYAVKDACSRQLMHCAGNCRLLPDDVEPDREAAKAIVAALSYLYDKRKPHGHKPRPTFGGTVDAVSRRNHLPRERVERTMHMLIKNEYLYQAWDKVDQTNIRVLRVNWHKVNEAHLL